MSRRRDNRAATADSVSIGSASVVNGLAAYALVVVVSRTFGEVEFAAFSVAWSIWALAVAVLIFPIQNWIIWRSSVDSGTGGLRQALPRVIGLAGVVLAILYLAGSSDRFFPDGEAWPWVLVAIGASSAMLGIGRGILGARGNYRAVAVVIASENVVRLAVALVVIAVGLGAEWAALSLAFGLAVIIPFAPRLRIDREAPVRPVRVMAELGTFAGATALAQVLIQFPPAFAEWLGESPTTVSSLFATFAIGRAPVLIILALTTRITEPLTRFVTNPSRDRAATFDRAVLWLVALVIVAFVTGLTAGPTVVSWFFGSDRALSALQTAQVAIGLTLAMAGVIAILLLLVLGAARRATVIWLFGVTLAVALGIWGIGIPLAFALAETATLCLAVLAIRAQLSERIDFPGA